MRGGHPVRYAGSEKSQRDSPRFVRNDEPERGPRLVMMVVGFCGRSSGAAFQEIIFFLLFVAILRTLWIVLFHFEFLLGGQRGQMTNEANEFPGAFDIVIMLRSCATKGRHSREAHAIFDDPENIAVRKFLRFFGAQIGWLGVQSAAKH